MKLVTRASQMVLFACILVLALPYWFPMQPVAAQGEAGNTLVETTTAVDTAAPTTVTPIITAEPKEITVVGGQPATRGEWPWQVMVRPGSYLCGGSLIAPNWVLTAAHCVFDAQDELFAPGNVTVVLGEHDRSKAEGSEQILSVAEVIAHADYDARTNNNDLALLRLTNAATINANVMPIALLTSPFDDSLTVAGRMATVTGWGTTAEGGNIATVLMEVALPIVTNGTCNQSYGIITDNMICAGYAAGGKDSCQGDSGGPLVVPDDQGGWRLTGIVSFGYGCARANYYGVYTRVSRYVTWIQEQTGIGANTPTMTPTVTPAVTPAVTPSPTHLVATPTATPTVTPTPITTPVTSTPIQTPTQTSTPSATPSATPTDSPVSTTLDPEVETVLSYAASQGGRIDIVVPAGAVDEPVTLQFDVQNSVQAQSQTSQVSKRAFQLIIYHETLAMPNYTFQSPIEISVTYTDQAISGLNEKKLTLFAYDPQTDSWTTDGITKIEHDLADNRLIVSSDQAAIFALGAQNEQIFLPLVLR